MEDNKLMNALLNLASKLQSNKYMTAVKNGFTALLPLVIGGAFFTLFLSVVLSTTTTGLSVAKIPGMEWLEVLTPMFAAANYATMNILTLGIVILIAIELGRLNGRDEIGVPVIALASFITLITTSVDITTEAGEVVTVANVISSTFTGSGGLFLAMFSTITSIEIYSKIANSGKLGINLPDSVPSNIAKSFNVLIPGVVTILIMAAIGFGFNALVGYSIHDAITKFIQTPLQGILTGLPGYLIMFAMTAVLWTFGIHGTQVLGPVYSASMLLALTQNTEAVLIGEKAPNILNSSFISVFTITTGAGLTGGLLISILLFSKRSDYKAIAKLSIVPGIFNINETMTFGLPIVLNPLFMLPFIIAPAVSATIGYFATKVGIAVPLAYAIPWTTPPLLSAFLASGGHLGTVLTQAVAIASSILIYAPFVIAANKQQEIEQVDEEN